MFETNHIMAKKNSNHITNTREVLMSVAWDTTVSSHGAIMP